MNGTGEIVEIAEKDVFLCVLRVLGGFFLSRFGEHLRQRPDAQMLAETCRFDTNSRPRREFEAIRLFSGPCHVYIQHILPCSSECPERPSGAAAGRRPPVL